MVSRVSFSDIVAFQGAAYEVKDKEDGSVSVFIPWHVGIDLADGRSFFHPHRFSSKYEAEVLLEKIKLFGTADIDLWMEVDYTPLEERFEMYAHEERIERYGFY